MGQSGIIWVVKKKTIYSGHIRLDEELSDELDLMRSNFGFKISRSAFVGSVIRAGIPVIKKMHNLQTDDSDPAESAFKK